MRGQTYLGFVWGYCLQWLKGSRCPLFSFFLFLVCVSCFSVLPGKRRAFVQGVRAGDGSLEDFLTTALSELCKVKPEGLDAVR